MKKGRRAAPGAGEERAETPLDGLELLAFEAALAEGFWALIDFADGRRVGGRVSPVRFGADTLLSFFHFESEQQRLPTSGRLYPLVSVREIFLCSAAEAIRQGIPGYREAKAREEGQKAAAEAALKRREP